MVALLTLLSCPLLALGPLLPVRPLWERRLPGHLWQPLPWYLLARSASWLRFQEFGLAVRCQLPVPHRLLQEVLRY